MKRNKKGFTLIELLAVIVILAVIALIAVPVVMNIVNKANKSAFKDTAYGIISAGELYFAEQQLKVDGMSGEKTFDLSKDVNTEDGLQIKGEVPNGTLKVNEKGETALAITNGRYCITKKYSDKDITVTEDLTNCNIPEEPKKLVQVVPDDNGGISGDGSSTGESTRPSCVTDETQCAAGTALAIQVNGSDTYKFYVLNDDGEKVTLIMAEDLGDDVYWNENPEVCVSFSEDYNEDGEIKEEDGEVGEECYPTSTSGPLTALEALKTRTQNWTNITAYSYELTFGTGEENYEGFYGASRLPFKPYSGEFVQNVRARLPKYSDLEGFLEYSSELGQNILPPWVFEKDFDSSGDIYWLSDAYPETYGSAWAVYGYSPDGIGPRVNFWAEGISDENHLLSNLASLRPVITITK